MSNNSSVVKDCNACHGAGIVRVRFVDNKHGKVHVITCPDCDGKASWVGKLHDALDPVAYADATALLLQFSEWRDRDEFGRPDPSLPSHTQLIKDFLAGRDVRALPYVRGVPQTVSA